jgi:hypothetical protein
LGKKGMKGELLVRSTYAKFGRRVAQVLTGGMAGGGIGFLGGLGGLAGLRLPEQITRLLLTKGGRKFLEAMMKMGGQLSHKSLGKFGLYAHLLKKAEKRIERGGPQHTRIPPVVQVPQRPVVFNRPVPGLEQITRDPVVDLASEPRDMRPEERWPQYRRR